MSRPLQLTQWQGQLASRFPALPVSVVAVLALYSFGMILAQVSGLSRVALWLSEYLGGSYDAQRKRLCEFYKEKEAKSGVKQGVKRQDFDVTTCFGPLLGWLLSLWSGRHLPLAIDVTNLGDRFHVLCVSVVLRGVGIPVAWKVLLGGVKEEWNPHWKKLLSHLQPVVPDDWTVIVLSDRGLESPELFRFIVTLNWHPLMRIKKGGKFQPVGWGRFYPLASLVRPGDPPFCVEGRAYSGQRLRCTLLSHWKEGCAEPWLLLTSLPPEAGNAVWYAFRAWIEQGFKLIKGGGWDWQNTRMEDPGRVERLWLVMAVATLWVVAVGADDEVQQQEQQEQQRVQRQLQESAEQAQQRQLQEQYRLQKVREAMAARQAKRELRRQARSQAKANKDKDNAATLGKTGKPFATKPLAPTGIDVQASPQRLHRIDRRGLAALEAAWLRGENRLPQQLHPEVWPQPCHPASTLTEQEFLARQNQAAPTGSEPIVLVPAEVAL